MAPFISEYLNPQNDVAFKHVFGQEKNKDILISMLNAVLEGQLHTPIQDSDVVASKQSIVDVLCKDQDGYQYIIYTDGTNEQQERREKDHGAIMSVPRGKVVKKDAKRLLIV